MDYQDIVYTEADSIATIAINRPEVMNAFRGRTLEEMLHAAGFSQVRVVPRPESRAFIQDWIPGSGAENFVASATIEAVKPGPVPAAGSCCGPSCCAPAGGA